MNTKRDLVLCGDIHGEFKKMIWQAMTKYEMKNTDIIVLGDFGVGFDNKIKVDYEETEARLEKNDIVVYALRGNHDDPEWFDGSHDFPRLKFLKDYEILTLGDNLSILPIGGACSADIEDRIKLNAERISKGKRPVWWEGEDIERKENLREIQQRVDLVISHEAPLLFDPLPYRDESDDLSLEQYNKILSSREYLKDIALYINTNYWCYGHYHKSMSGNFKDMIWRGLGIMEFYKVPEKKSTNPQGELLEKDQSLIYEE